MINPGFRMWVMLPSPPRANAFWRDTPRSLDIVSSLVTRLTEHPIETPVYISLQERMKGELSRIIQTGRLGIVDSNDIFLFVSSDNISAFVHIIGFEPSGVAFQLRGLEYKAETSCHRSEISAVCRHAERASHPSLRQMMRAHAECHSQSWSLRALGIRFETYSITVQPFERCWWLVDSDRLTILAMIAFVRTAAQFPQVLEQVEPAPFADTTIQLAATFLESDSAPRCQTLFDAIFKPLLPSSTNRGMCAARLAALFHDRLPAEEFPGHEEIVRTIVCPAVRRFVLLMALASMDPFSRNREARKVVKDLVKADKEWAVAPIGAPEFKEAMKVSGRHLLTIEEKTMRLIIFRATESEWDVFMLQREVVRSFWATEAQAQTFFGERNPERSTIQANPFFLHNLIIQAANSPTGYPAVVSPVIESTGWPFR
jgi:hypothetical protein